MTTILVDSVKFSSAPPQEVRTGLLGWVSFIFDGLVRVDGVTVRWTRDRRLTLSWPSRVDRAGLEHPYICPISDGARRALEGRILKAIGFTIDEGQA